MTHYEELGVSPDAPAEEIRRAFRRTSRLLHPDLQSVPELRQAAEVQMRRLNEIVEMLCQPESRAHYDRTLSNTPALNSAPVQAEPTRGPIHPSLIAGLAFGALAMFCWNIVSSAPTLVERTDSSSSEAPMTALAPSPAQRVRSRVSSGALLRRSTNSESLPTYPTTSSPEAEPKPSEVAIATAPPLPSPEVTASVATPASPKTQAPNAQSLDGVWLLFRDPQEKLGPGEFAAEFVELRLHQNGDHFSAAYRSRYRIPDRVSSPEVSFRFEGSIHSQEFSWSGRSGSQGKVRLTLNSPDTLNLEWVAEARIPGSLLSEGSAKLVRLRTD